MTTLDLTADMIDVRDIIERVEHLEKLRIPGAVDMGPEDNEMDQDTLFRELNDLETILGELRNCGGDEQWRGDWYPVTLVRASYFVEYARDLVQDVGDLPDSVPAYIVIDWDKTAENLLVDYSSVTVDGNEYYYR